MNFKNQLFIGILILIAGCLFGYWSCHARWQTKESRQNEYQAQKETRQLEKTIADNQNLQKTITGLQQEIKKENDNAKQKYDLLLARVNRGTTRVSIPASACRSVSASHGAIVDHEQSRAELDPETFERILSVGRDGDQHIRELNQCIDQYQELAKRCEHP